MKKIMLVVCLFLAVQCCAEPWECSFLITNQELRNPNLNNEELAVDFIGEEAGDNGFLANAFDRLLGVEGEPLQPLDDGDLI